MPALTCYRITTRGHEPLDFDDVLDSDGPGVLHTEEAAGVGFAAKVFVLRPPPHTPSWAPFLREGFSELTVGQGTSPSALLLVRAESSPPDAHDLMFAFAFGPTGRFLLRRDSYERGYGLRAALNLIYPRASARGPRLRAVDSKRRGQTIVRSRAQSSSQAEFEVFDVNRLQDVLSKAIGEPADRRWGSRTSGGDALALNLDLRFQDLGELCRDIERAHAQRDYEEGFAWIDDIQPVTDPGLIGELEELVIDSLRTDELDALDLAPPEIVDWDRVAAFRYHFDRKRRGGGSVLHPDLRIVDYAAGLRRTGALDTLEAGELRRTRIFAVDGDESEQAKWSVWSCLVGEFKIGAATYLLDEGEFFVVSRDYMGELNGFVNQIPEATLPLPNTTPSTIEGVYNENASVQSSDLLLLDRKTVRLAGRTTPIEICDLLSKSKDLIHVKRHLGSSDLSHLFAQGLVSAELLQSSIEFRTAVRQKILEASGGSNGFNFLTDASITTSDFRVVFAIAARWKGRRLADALPFFSKVNLREVTTNLTSRGFNVALQQISAG